MSDDKQRQGKDNADSDANRDDPVANTRNKAEEAVREYSEKSAEGMRKFAEETAQVAGKSAESAKKLGEESTETARKMAEQSVEATKRFTNSSVEATRHFAEKARSLGDRTPEITSHVLEQTTKFTRDVFGRLHEGWSSAYEASSKFMQEAYHTTSAYAERHKSTVVMKKLTAEREKLNQKLGSVIYTKYKDEGVAPEDLFELDEVREILTQCENVDNEVLRIGQELDKKED